MPYKKLIESSERVTPRIVNDPSSSSSTQSFQGVLHPIPQLQRTLGNRNIAQLIQTRRLTPEGRIVCLQPKLTVGAADDQYEQEADRVARQVMNTPDAAVAKSMQRAMSPEEDKDKMLQTKPLAASITPFMQRDMMSNEEPEDKDKSIQAKLLAKTNIDSLQRQTEAEDEEKEPIPTNSAGATSGSFEAGVDVETHVNQNKGRGSPLPDSVRTYMEPRFGVDFSHVRVHTGSDAKKMSRDVGAHAFTHGSDIYFGANQSPTNLELTAHELTHVIQQTGSRPLQTKGLNEDSSAISHSSVQRICSACADKKEERVAGSNSLFVQRTIGDGHDLTSLRFSGDPILEACFDNERLLRVGSRGDAVRKLQQALVDAGFPLPKFGVDGDFGSETQTAVRNFQQASGISVDGLVGPQTMGALDTRFSGSTPPTPTPPTPTPPTPTPPTPTPATITSETVATSPGARSRTTIGVGENVNLTHSAGSTAWTTTDGSLSATTGATVMLTAPDTAQTVTVTAGSATIVFTVIAPSGVHMDRFTGTGIRHTHGFPDSGIQTRPFLLPDIVNFSNVQYHEVDIGAVANGTYSCHNGTGHDAHPATLTLTNTVVSGKGTQANARDTVYSGHCGGSAPFTPGSISFAIPYEYKVGTGSFHSFATVNQVHVLAADAATLTTDKAGAHGDTTVNAATSAF